MNLLINTVIATVAYVSATGPEPQLSAAIEGLSPTQQVRIQTRDFRELRGYFIRSSGDSIYLASSSEAARTLSDRNRGDSQLEETIDLSQINLMWKVDDHGVGRGFLWGGGVLLVGAALIYAGGDKVDSPELAMAYIGVTIAVATFAFYKGTKGSKETLVYYRFRP